MKKTILVTILAILVVGSLICTENVKVQASDSVENIDFNGNGEIDLVDLSTLADRYNSRSIDSNWNAKYDLNADNIVDIYDLVKVSRAIGTKVTIAEPDDKQDITSEFTDENFKAAIYDKIGKDKSKPILYGDIKNIDSLYLSSKNISSLNGIKLFKSLGYLYCSNNKLTSLDLSNNKKLYILDCSENQIESLGISKNLELESLYCSSNKITNLDISNNVNLKYLSCNDNEISKIDLSNNTALESLDCSANKLVQLDVSKNTMLNSLHCNSLKVNYDGSIDESRGKLKSIDITNNVALEYLDCSYNELANIDLAKNKNLVSIQCDNNNFTNLDISKNVALENLNCSYNTLLSLDVSNNIKLDALYCNQNYLKSLDISKNTNLQYFNCSYNEIKTLYSYTDKWEDYEYKTQYKDGNHNYDNEVKGLVITIKH